MFQIPPDHLRQPENIPAFWVSTVEEVNRFLDEQVRKGTVQTIGTTAGGRPMRAVCYGQPRQGRGTTTFSGAIGCRDIGAYRGPDHARTAYLGLGAVHGGEFEGIVGMVNLISVLETGTDLRGRAWPEITAAASRLDRVVLLPITNVDGRARVPLRMIAHQGSDNTIHEYFNTGTNADGTNLGWPQCKQFIPLDFSRSQFPGGYPNDAGVNIMHDDFLGSPQPETRALLDLCARERPDLILNMHTGAPPRNYYTRMHRPFMEAALAPTFEALYRQVHTGLALAGLQETTDPTKEVDETMPPAGVYNLDTALNLHCGALSVVVEAPSHCFNGTNRGGTPVQQTPDLILDAQLVVHQEAMKFLGGGGRATWTPAR